MELQNTTLPPQNKRQKTASTEPIKSQSSKLSILDDVALPQTSQSGPGMKAKGMIYQDHVAEGCSMVPPASFDYNKNNKGEENTNEGDRKANTPDLSKVSPDPVGLKKETKMDIKSKVSLKLESMKEASIPSSSQPELFVDKYKPINCESIIGQQGEMSPMNRLRIWLSNWNKIPLKLSGKKGCT